MKVNKVEGFTLIELLAVIVILAIIALIATPIVLNIIKESRESAQLRSAEMYLDAVEYGIAEIVLNNKIITDGTYTIMENGNICIGTLENNTCTGEILEVEVNGSIPNSGSTITFKDNQIKSINLAYGDKTIIKNENGSLVYGEDSNTKYIPYIVGDEIVIGTETFYVIADSDETQEKVTLLAKDNIDTTTLVQSASANEAYVAFSNTNYWSSETEYSLNLNDYTIPESTISIIKIAKTYGEKIGGTGRLMTNDEATALEIANSDILYGKNGKSSSSYLGYWLGSAYNDSSVWYADGRPGILGGISCWNYGYTSCCGVRPVVEISKSKLN